MRTDSRTAGFTLIEVIVAMTLLVIVAGFVVSVYLFARKAVSDWESGIALYNTAHVVQQRMTTDLRRADRVYVVRPDSVVLMQEVDQTPVTYSFRDSTIYRTGVSMVDSDLRVLSMMSSMAESDSAQKPRRIARISYMIASPRDTLMRVATAAIRGGQSWNIDGRE